MSENDAFLHYKHAIAKSGLTIYDPVSPSDADLWIPNEALQHLIGLALLDSNLAGLPLRTRSKVVKELVCASLGYPIPQTFKKTRPRFIGQDFDTYIQKSSNLQIWNEEIQVTRRYVILQVDENDIIVKVRVITGNDLARYDTTGTLTAKYQAQIIPSDQACEIISSSDTSILAPYVGKQLIKVSADAIPTSAPYPGRLLTIDKLFALLSTLVGKSFINAGADQERNRGFELHRMVCIILGYTTVIEDGQFPDIPEQLLEIKLQTSPTIDLGLVNPNSETQLSLSRSTNMSVRHCDVRYAIYYGKIQEGNVRLTNLIISTGVDFFSRFRQFQGKVINKKIQIPLPSNFFGS